MNVTNHEKLLKVIIGPYISEKSTFLSEKNNQAVFKVSRNATKKDIKEAVELLWKDQKIEVDGVQTINIKGKRKRFGRYFGKRSDWKKAIVNIKNGQEINFSNLANIEAK